MIKVSWRAPSRIKSKRLKLELVGKLSLLVLIWTTFTGSGVGGSVSGHPEMCLLRVGGTSTCKETCLLLAVAEVRVGIRIPAHGLVAVLRLNGWCLPPALPLNHVGHSALPHGCGLCHVVLHAS